MSILVIYKNKNRFKQFLNVRIAGDHMCGKFAVHLAVAGSVYDSVFFFAVLFLTIRLG